MINIINLHIVRTTAMWATDKYITLLESLCEIKRLFDNEDRSECLRLVENNIDENENCPDLWIVKAILVRSNPQLHNYCVMKARSLLSQNINLLIFKTDDLKNLKCDMPDNWFLNQNL
jgi:hypothetical protein